MQIYGSPLPTSPNLSKLIEAQNLFVFDDTVSPQTHTTLVLERLLTFANYENNATAWYEQMNLIDAMKLLGYESIWLSNQEQISIYANTAEVFAKRADLSLFSNLSIGDNAGDKFPKDEILLKMFDEIKPKLDANKNHFFIFHLMGAHGGYANRYPQKFAKFDAEFLRKNGFDKFQGSQKSLNDFQLSVRAEYANAVLYNDFVVSELMQKFKDDEAIVLYISDHGDEVFDYRDFVGHSWVFVSRYMVEVPFMVYLSDKFKAAHPQILARVQAAQHKPFMSDNLIHALFDLLDIECVELDKALSPFNGEFNANRARIIGGKDYDKELKEPEFYFLAPDKIWLHRTDELKKVEDFYGTYQNFEIDTHFFDENLAQRVGKNEAYFDVGHDGVEHSVGLDLAQMLEFIRQKEAEFKQKAPKIQTNSKIWLDFKNLNAQNSAPALQKLIKIADKAGFKRGDIIVKSGAHEQLRAFRAAGFYTSYYVPYFELGALKKDGEQIAARLRAIAASGAVDALSFPYYLYDFIKSLGLGCDLLTWNEGKAWGENMGEKAFSDPQIKVILAGEQGEYR